MGAASQGNASAAGGENRLEEEGEGRHVGNVNVSQGNVSQGNVSQQTSASAKRNSQRFMCERVYQHKHPFVRTSSGSRSRIKVSLLFVQRCFDARLLLSAFHFFFY
jgi:hypothetical protein